MTLTSFFPNHARAFIVSPPSRTLKCGVTSAGEIPSFYIPSCGRYAQQTAEHAVFATHILKSVCECLHDEVSDELRERVEAFSRELFYTRPTCIQLSTLTSDTRRTSRSPPGASLVPALERSGMLQTPLALQNEVVWCCLPVTTTTSPEAVHDLSIPDPLHVLNGKLDLECIRLRETRL